jgi:hypothetical protein
MRRNKGSNNKKPILKRPVLSFEGVKRLCNVPYISQFPPIYFSDTHTQRVRGCGTPTPQPRSSLADMPLPPITDELLRRMRETLDRLESLSLADPSDRDLSALKSIEKRIKEIEDRTGNQAA